MKTMPIPTKEITFALTPLPPFRLDLTVWALRRRPHNMVDVWNGQSYRRLLLLDGTPCIVEVVQEGTPDTSRLLVTIRGAPDTQDSETTIAAALRHMLGLDIDVSAFYELASTDERLHSLAAPLRGFKPPRYSSVYEALLNGIACQQVTLNFGIQLLNRLAATYGVSITDGSATLHTLPRPEVLAEQTPESLRSLGFSQQKARAMIEIAQAHNAGQLRMQELISLDDEAAVNYLRRFRGVGRWTAEYVLLRGLGRLHIFPSGDSGARNSVQRWLNPTETLDYEGVRNRLAQWQSYAGLIYLHLLVSNLARSQSTETT
jgi:DNA-3-methyladenine glycosylase II